MSEKQTLPITVIILTHRHDRRFKRALASAQPAAEVLVVDFNSDNDWQGLKKKFHFTKISRQGPIENFSAERNSALKKAKHDWVFFLDSDEVIEEKSWPEIASSIKQSQLKGVFVKRRDVFYNRVLRFGETGNVWLLRLMRKEATEFVRPVHEVATVAGNTAHAKIHLRHHAHLDLNEFLKDIAQYAQIEAEYQQDHHLPNWLLAIKTILFPLGKFLHNYFLKLGLLDGWRGLTYAVMMSLHSLFVRVFSYENR